MVRIAHSLALGQESERDAGVHRSRAVTAKVVRRYFDILEDTYLGFRLGPWRKARRRRLIETEKFFLFDVGVSNYLARRRPQSGSAEFGKSFEHYILMELRAYQSYRQPDLELRFWRTAAGHEVDVIAGDLDLAIEVKGGIRVHDGDLRGLRALAEEGRVRRRVVVCLETQPRRSADGIDVLPWRMFLERLWAGDLGV